MYFIFLIINTKYELVIFGGVVVCNIGYFYSKSVVFCLSKKGYPPLRTGVCVVDNWKHKKTRHGYCRYFLGGVFSPLDIQIRTDLL